MSKRYSVATDLIKEMCRLAGINYSKKTFNNFKLCLETYSRVRKFIDILPSNIRKVSLSELAPEIFSAMISPVELTAAAVRDSIIVMMKNGYLIPLMEASLEGVASFNPSGQVYYQIITRLYFSDDNPSNTDVEKELKYSHAIYYKKKEEAVMLFGVFFWSQVLKCWDGAYDEMLALERANNRTISLAEGLKKYE